MRPITSGLASEMPAAPSATTVSGPMALWIVLTIAGSRWVSAKKKHVQAIAVVMLAMMIVRVCPRNLRKLPGARINVTTAKISVESAKASSMTAKKLKR
jgi:hypothetical protein